MPEPTQPTREEAWELLCEWTKTENLRKHALAVEACVRAYARKHGEHDEHEEFWGVTALLHDFDYERYPDAADHPFKGCEVLREKGYPEEMVRAILSHADYSGVARESQLEKVLFACDELAGFLTACTLVRPSKNIGELPVKSVKKRLKDKAFARGVNRDDVRNGAEDLGVPLEDHIAFCIDAMKSIAPALGLDGSAATS